MNPVPVFYFMVVAAVMVLSGGAVAVRAAHKLTRTLRRMRESPSLRVADARPGLLELNGTVQPTADVLKGPITARACVFWRFVVEERKTQTVTVGGRPMFRTRWVSLVDDRAHVPCRLKDDSGEVGLELGGAEMVLTNTVHTLSGPFRDVPVELEQLLRDRYGKSTK